MTLTKRKKKVRAERKQINPDEKCQRCGKSLKNSKHHFFCNDCWLPRELVNIPEYKLSFEEKKKLRDMI